MMYDSYAAVYDGSGQVRFALLMGQYLEQLLRAHPVPGTRALDLACGTGTLALMLARTGWHVVGVDSSAAMLVQARAKAAHAELTGSVDFVQDDMRTAMTTLSPAAFDLVTCTYDSLNYMLTESDLGACFDTVASALVPGGLFIGDMNTRHFLEYDWGRCEVQEQSGYVQVGQSHFDSLRGISTLQLTGFVGNDRHGYTRFDETHVERAYPDAIVRTCIAEAGLEIEVAYDCFTTEPPTDTTQRIAWVVRKPYESS